MTSWSSSIKIWFLQAYRNKVCHGVKQNAKICAIGETDVMKLEVIIVNKELIRSERRGGREGEEGGLRKGVERG